jgi:pimeloyl-ACP methyl ester carboxylesterase
MPDYEGLGSPGIHPYLDARTAGLNMIDAVRALGHTCRYVSKWWAALGHSQGGGAAWAADEQARTYAPELDLIGAVALAPAADVSGFIDKVQAGTLTSDQRLAFTLIVESLARRFPDVNRDDYRRGAVAQSWDVLTACAGPLVEQRPAASARLAPTDISPATPAAAARLREPLTRWALPQEPLTAPMYVVYGSRDTLIDAQWTTDAIARACALGGTVEWDQQGGRGHGDIDFGEALTWIVERFAGGPVVNECP